MTDQTQITHDWLTSVDFKWRQDERQPNKHWSLHLNVLSDGMMERAKIEVQRCGWHNDLGDYIGDPNLYMVWVTDYFGRTTFLRRMQWVEEIISLTQLICGYPWNPENHKYGQTWPEGRVPA